MRDATRKMAILAWSWFAAASVSLLIAVVLAGCGTPGSLTGPTRCSDGKVGTAPGAQEWRGFELQTAPNWAVQATASGKFRISGSSACFVVENVALSTRVPENKPNRVIAVRLGFAHNLQGKDGWEPLAYSLPHAVYADAPIKGSLALTPFETTAAKPGDLPPEAWVTMEVQFIPVGVAGHATVYAQETKASWAARMDRK